MSRSPLVLCLPFALAVLGCGTTAITVEPDGGAAPCQPNPCQELHRTVCSASGSSATCSCEAGYVEQGGVCVAAVSCEPNPCTAPHRSVCAAISDGVTCACDPRFHDDGAGTCVPDDPCQDNPCTESHRTVCRTLGSTVVCSCDEGYWDQGSCVPAGTCSPNPCTQPHRSLCSFDGKSVSCGCDAGFADDGKGACVAQDPCLPNPCTGAHRTVCRASGATAVCSCEAGYWDREGTCIAAVSCSPNPCNEPHRSVCSSDGSSVSCACDPGFAEDGTGRCAAIDPCQPNPCFELHRGLCRVVGGAAVCSCDSGYWDQGGCVPAVSCTPNPCTTPHQSVCSIDQASVVCACDPGYQANGAGGCAAIDPCQPNPCTGAHRAVCRASGSAAICSCDPGFRDDGQGACVDACNPNPCTAPHQGVCSVGPTGFRCGCDTGYVDDGAGGCSFQAPVDCPAAHDTGDAYEPDDCASLARVVTLPVFEAHTLNLATDNDWLAFDAKAGKAYVATVSPNAGVRVDFLSGTNQVLATSVVYSSGQANLVVYPGAGRILLRVKPYGTSNPNSLYSLQLKEVDDDVPNDAAGAMAQAVGPTTAHSLEYVGDEDWFSFQAVPGHLYRVMVSGAGQLQYRLWDVAGANNPNNSSPLASKSGSGGSLEWRATVSATYYVQVLSYSSGTSAGYSLTVEDHGLDDHGDTAATATEVSLGTAVSGVISATLDTDFFRFSALPGRFYRVTVTGAGSVGASLFDVDGLTLLDFGEGTTATLYFKSASTSPYYLGIRQNSPTSYTVLVEDGGPDDYGDSFTDATPLLAGTTVSGTLQSRRDRDFFSLTTVPGHVYKFELAMTAPSPTCSVYLSDGKTQVGSGSPIIIGASGTGPYYVEVGQAFNYWALAMTPYTVTVTDLGIDDHGGNVATATRLALDTPTAGAIDYPTDRDYFVFGATASHIYSVSIIPSGPTVHVTLFANNGATLLASATSDPTVSLRTRATSTGDLHVEVQNDGNYSPLGPYMVQVVDLGPDDHGDASNTATPVTPGTTVAGNIQMAGDADWFALATTAGRIYRCTVSPVGFTARVRLVSRDHIELGNLVGYQPMSFTFRSSISGHHYLAVAGGITGAIGTYTVLAEDLGVDDVGDTPASATPLVVGDPAVAGSLQFANDVDVFSFAAAAGALSPKLVLTGPTTVSVQVTTSTGTTVISGKGPGTHPLTLPSAGTYYVTVSSPTLQTGSYSVQLVP